jgi:hypothetical protein
MDVFLVAQQDLEEFRARIKLSKAAITDTETRRAELKQETTDHFAHLRELLKEKEVTLVFVWLGVSVVAFSTSAPVSVHSSPPFFSLFHGSSFVFRLAFPAFPPPFSILKAEMCQELELHASRRQGELQNLLQKLTYCVTSVTSTMGDVNRHLTSGYTSRRDRQKGMVRKHVGKWRTSTQHTTLRALRSNTRFFFLVGIPVLFYVPPCLCVTCC